MTHRHFSPQKNQTNNQKQTTNLFDWPHVLDLGLLFSSKPWLIWLMWQMSDAQCIRKTSETTFTVNTLSYYCSATCNSLDVFHLRQMFMFLPGLCVSDSSFCSIFAPKPSVYSRRQNQILKVQSQVFRFYLQLYTWNSEAGVGLMDCNVPPSLHTALRLLSIPLPAVTPRRARAAECDRAAASSVLAAHCISGEMNLLPCASLWHSVKVLLVFIWVLQYSGQICAKISLFASGGRRAYANVDVSSVC